MILEGSTTASAFEVDVEQILAPRCEPGQLVVLDNLSAHKSQRVQALIEARGGHLLCLPSSSPDLSPIEEAKSCAESFFTPCRSPHP